MLFQTISLPPIFSPAVNEALNHNILQADPPNPSGAERLLELQRCVSLIFEEGFLIIAFQSVRGRAQPVSKDQLAQIMNGRPFFLLLCEQSPQLTLVRTAWSDLKTTLSFLIALHQSRINIA